MSDSIFESDNLYPLSHGQRALWFVQRLAPNGVAYNFAHAARILTELDIIAFQRAIQQLVRRHPALRTTFPSRDGEPAQRIHDHAEFHFRTEDATWWSEAQLNERLAEEVYRPFDLAHGPLLRIFLFTRSDREHVVLLVTHHIVADLWSVVVVMSELGALYSAEKSGGPLGLSSPPTHDIDYVRQQAESMTGPESERLWAFWRKQLAGAPPMLNLRTDRPWPPVQTDRGASRTLRLGQTVSQGLKVLARTHGATLFMTLLAAFQALLHRYTGQEDILVASPMIRRGREAANLVGYFINPVVLRADFSGDPTFSSFLDQVRQTALEAFEHSAYPFPLLIEQLQPARDPSRPPLVQVAFTWQQTTRVISNQAMAAFAVGEKGGGRLELGKLQFESMALEPRVAPFELLLLMAEASEELIATVEYNTDLFDGETMERMLEHFQTLLEGVVADPKRRISDAPLLTARELSQELVEWNRAPAECTESQCVHQRFAEVAGENPQATALVNEEEQLTYERLNERANQLAHYLMKRGIGPEVLVGICMERSIDMAVSLLGILKAGGAFLPLDPAYPRERLAYMIKDSGARMILTRGTSEGGIWEREEEMIRLESEWEMIGRESTANPEAGTTPENLAYVIYTSGSTGQPKGTMLHHRGLRNLIEGQRRGFNPGASDRILQFSSLSFDASVWEVVMALMAGGSLVLPRRESLATGQGLVGTMREQGITIVTLPPSMLGVMPEEGLPELHTIITAGEKCPGALAGIWGKGRRFLNAYGPTETTVCASIYELGEKDVIGREGRGANPENPPIGRPITNFQIYVLDGQMRPAAVGIAGELYIGGVGLGRGYLNRPEQTAERFIPHPFSEEVGARLYKSGDLVRRLSDGNVEYVGRIDHQVKVRGFRIELGEIEAVLRGREEIREVVVMAREDAPGERRLVAYLAVGPGQSPPINELRNLLRERLPDYMVPSAFVTLQSFPLTPSGKVDRSALPPPERPRPELEAGYVRPRNEIERVIAEVWQKVLGIERVGVHDNFFDLGGHSLMLAKIHSQMQEVLNRELPMIEMFKYPTISALADYLSREDGGQPSFQMSRQRAREQMDAMNLG